ncbi:MAG: hypothetical protein Q9181_007324 [Wetmoreana brouardii]
MFLASDGNYFTPWMKPRGYEEYHLPRMIQKLQGETHCKFGDAVISTPDTCIGVETCEELFTPDAPHTHMALDGVEVGEVVAQGNQFLLDDVEVIVATVDLEEIRAYRSSVSRCYQATASDFKYERIQTSFALSSEAEDLDIRRRPSPPIQPRYYSPEEEIALCAGCYLWDYLRRSNMAGFLLPSSGGIDSCATAILVFSMCRLVVESIKTGNQQVIADVQRLAKFSEKLPESPQELCNQIFHTLYLGMSKQSSKETRQRSKDLSGAIGAYHTGVDIDEVYEAQRNLIVNNLGFEPKFQVEGGTNTENLVLQNIQAVSARKRPGGGSLLVLGAANVGESLRGYLTKYGTTPLSKACLKLRLSGLRITPLTLEFIDCSSADINPIGAIDKADLKRLIAWAEKEFDLPCLHDFLTAIPTAELEPITDSYVQSDEVDMGMTYDELTVFGRLRKVHKLGAYGMFQRLVHEWSSERPRAPGDDTPALEPRQVAEKVKRFHHYYAVNRHKMTTLTPSLHSNDYSADDNRFDMRPFLYPPAYDSHDFMAIDEELAKIEQLRKR